MQHSAPQFATYVLVDTHTGKVVSTHKSRAEARSAKDAAGDHALRVRGGMTHAERQSITDLAFSALFSKAVA